MSRKGLLLFVAAASLAAAGCQHAAPISSDLWIDPGEAVLRAAAAKPRGITGVFAMSIKATGRSDKVHLNSELDYRDPRNLSIAVMPTAAAELEATLGSAPEVALKGKRILVSGTARTVRIDFLTDSGPTGKYYYQTHVRVDRASQIKVL
jgi:hypothetical protein